MNTERLGILHQLDCVFATLDEKKKMYQIRNQKLENCLFVAWHSALKVNCKKVHCNLGKVILNTDCIKG